MSQEKKKIGDCTVNCSEEVINLLVLIAGTTDPVNTYADTRTDKRAMSYVNKDRYWNKEFYAGIQELVHSTRGGLLFDLHGWSGDNRQANREIAGAYLVNRLSGNNGEKAFYPAYKKKKVHLHLVGHSHGGNVINEMTKQMSKLGSKWPSTWKVKSFTYLSTPFFKKIHQVKIGAFVHPQAEVFHVYNQYDYTQRMLADFSLFTLNDAVRVNEIDETVKSNLAGVMAAFNAVPWNLAGTDGGWRLNRVEGRRLYTAARDALGATNERSGFKSVVQIFESIEKIAIGLNKPVQYKVNKAIQANNKVTQSFKLLSDSNLANLRTVIAALTTNVNRSVGEFDTAIANNSYSRAGFGSAFLAGGLPLARNLAAFLSVPAGAINVARSGILWQTIVSLLGDAIEVFDDTVTKPDTQFNGSRPITFKEVTNRDPYDKSAQKANALGLLTRIETLEKRVTGKPEANLLFDLLLTLLVHNPQVRAMAQDLRTWAGHIETLEWVVTGDLDTAAREIRATFTNLSNALLSRFVGEIEDASHTRLAKDKDGNLEDRRGSLPYLLKVSHSTSREVLHPEVKAFLQRMMEK
jgi:hypothetical protein